MAIDPTPATDPADPRPRLRALALLLPFAVGMGIRLSNLRGQILLGDELHALRAALAETVPQALTTYRVTDNCIPLTALYRFLMDHGVRLDEATLRLPVLVFTGLFLLVAPWLVARRFGLATGLLFGALAALSPLLVFYGRIVRSYMPAVALSFVAALACFLWLDERRARWAVTYVVCGALAVWFHLLTGPIVALPLIFAAALWVAGERRAPWPLLATGAGLALALGAFLLPALGSLRAVLAQKVGENPLPAIERWHAVASLFSGTAVPPLAIGFWLFAIFGLVLLFRDERRAALYALLLVLGHTGALLVLRPYALDSPVVFTRYMLPVLPWVLLAAARGLVGLGTAAAAPRPLAVGAAAAFLIALAVAGPLGDPALRRSSFLHSAPYLLFTCPRPALDPDDVPTIYRTIAALPGRGAIVETPGASVNVPAVLRVYQEIHGRPVETSAQRLLQDRRLGLRNMVATRPAALLHGKAAWVLVHRHFEEEERRLSNPVCFAHGAVRLSPIESRRMADAARHLETQLGAAWGPPDSDADGVVAWNLDRVRREVGAAPEPRVSDPRSPASAGARAPRAKTAAPAPATRRD